MKYTSCLLKQKGDICDIIISTKFDIENPNANTLPIESKCNGDIELLATWDNIDVDDSKYLLFGWPQGSHNDLNKTSLPPPYDELNLYGDAVMIMLNNNDKITNFSSDNFEEFYKYVAEGFEDINEYDYDEEDNALYGVDNDNYINDDNDNEYEYENKKNKEENENIIITFNEICDSELSEDDYLTEEEI